VLGHGISLYDELSATEREKTISYWSALIRSSATRNGHNPDIGEAFMDKDREVKIGDRVVHTPRRDALLEYIHGLDDAPGLRRRSRSVNGVAIVIRRRCRGHPFAAIVRQIIERHAAAESFRLLDDRSPDFAFVKNVATLLLNEPERLCQIGVFENRSCDRAGASASPTSSRAPLPFP
jgi:hypothetical protein